MEQFQSYTLGKNAISLSLEEIEEEMQLVQVVWTINQVRLNVEPQQFKWERSRVHAVQLAATTSTLEMQQRIKLITAWPRNERLPHLPDVFSMKLLFWNCRGAGNENFRNTVRDLHRDHCLDVIVLLETKIPFIQVGDVFNQLGFYDSITVDPNGRAGVFGWFGTQLMSASSLVTRPASVFTRCSPKTTMRNGYSRRCTRARITTFEINSGVISQWWLIFITCRG